MVLEAGRAVAGALGLGDPQLHAVQLAAVAAGGLLGVGDAVPGRHQVELAGPDELGGAEAVPVQHLAGSSQVTVWRPMCGMGADVQAGRRRSPAPGPCGRRSTRRRRCGVPPREGPADRDPPTSAVRLGVISTQAGATRPPWARRRRVGGADRSAHVLAVDRATSRAQAQAVVGVSQRRDRERGPMDVLRRPLRAAGQVALARTPPPGLGRGPWGSGPGWPPPCWPARSSRPPADHPYREIEDPAAQRQQRIHFFKNVTSRRRAPGAEWGAAPPPLMAARYRRRLAQQHAAAVYRALAAKRAGEDREILLALARAEERHAAPLVGQAAAGGAGGRPARLADPAVRLAGPAAGVAGGAGAGAAGRGRRRLRRRRRATPAMAADEQVHALVVAELAQRQRARASGWFQAAVFGVNDGLVSNFSLVAGMAGAGTSSEIILLAGLAGLLAGALSMAAGEYVSVRSQRELLDAAAHELDPATLATLRDHEAHELALVFRARGCPRTRPSSGSRPCSASPTTRRQAPSRGGG